MKILAVAANFPSRSRPHNGIFVKNLLVEIARLGHEVSVIAPQKAARYAMPKEAVEDGIVVFRPRFISFGNLTVWGIKTRLLSHLFFKLAVLLFAVKGKLRFDVLYSHFLFPSGDSAVMLSKWFGKPVFCSLGESTFEAYEEVYSRGRIKNILNRFCLVFPNSRDKNEYVARIYGNDLKLLYVPNGVDTSVFYPISKAEARSRLGLSVTDPIVLFVGGFIDRKGPLRVLAACEKLPEMPKMVFVGDGDQKPLHPQIIYCGNARQDELQLYYNAADVFVTASRKEGMPNATLEAMACSCRIVASDIPVHRELLEGYGRGVLCDGEDPSSLSIAIHHMLVMDDDSAQCKFKYTLEERARTIVKCIEAAVQDDILM